MKDGAASRHRPPLSRTALDIGAEADRIVSLLPSELVAPETLHAVRQDIEALATQSMLAGVAHAQGAASLPPRECTGADMMTLADVLALVRQIDLIVGDAPNLGLQFLVRLRGTLSRIADEKAERMNRELCG